MFQISLITVLLFNRPIYTVNEVATYICKVQSTAVWFRANLRLIRHQLLVYPMQSASNWSERLRLIWSDAVGSITSGMKVRGNALMSWFYGDFFSHCKIVLTSPSHFLWDLWMSFSMVKSVHAQNPDESLSSRRRRNARPSKLLIFVGHESYTAQFSTLI